MTVSSLPALLKHVASRLERVRDKYSGRPDSAETIDLDDDDARELGHAVALLRLIMARLVAPEPRRRPSARWRFYWPVVSSMPREHWRRQAVAKKVAATGDVRSAQEVGPRADARKAKVADAYRRIRPLVGFTP